MTFSKLKTMKKDRGFTIVELLIVIVVIAVLAAIVIVAYNGVTNNARDSNDKANAVSIAKVAESVNADKGYYPGGTGDSVTVTTSATLKTSFDQGTTSKLPNGLSVIYLASGGTDPTYTTVRDNSDNSKSYTVKVCGGTTGLTIFYAQRKDTSVQKQNVGTGC